MTKSSDVPISQLNILTLHRKNQRLLRTKGSFPFGLYWELSPGSARLLNLFLRFRGLFKDTVPLVVPVAEYSD